MLLVSEFSVSSAYFADRFCYLARLQVFSATLITFISPCWRAAVWAYAFYVPVGEKHAAFGAVTLAYRFLIDMPIVDE
jgi:cytochrome c biogenesis protein CcdA